METITSLLFSAQDTPTALCLILGVVIISVISYFLPDPNKKS